MKFIKSDRLGLVFDNKVPYTFLQTFLQSDLGRNAGSLAIKCIDILPDTNFMAVLQNALPFLNITNFDFILPKAAKNLSSTIQLGVDSV